jgi:phenylacetate-CoA ligase
MNSTLSKAALRLHERLTGRQILERLEELNSTQWLSHDQLMALQVAKLRRLLEYAYHYVPYYRRTFIEVGFNPGDLQQDLSLLKKIPVLTKDIIRNNFSNLLTTEPERRRRMSRLSTSGSTGQPLVFMQDNDFRDAVTADVQRHLGWAGWSLGDLQALIWGSSLQNDLQRRLRTELIDWVWNRFQLNAFLMNEEAMAAFAEHIRRYKPRILFGYATSIYQFAIFIRRNSYPDIKFDSIVTTAEVLLPSARQIIEDTFEGKVYNRYGTLELGGMACECDEHNGLHISVENNFVEILREGVTSKSR